MTGVKRHSMYKKGEITLFVSLLMSVLLFFLQAALTSARCALLRSQTEEALELAETSVLSEYQSVLLERYGLFYLDLGYGTGIETTDYLNQRIGYFLNENLSQGKVSAIDTWDFSRATDDGGTAYYEQAVSLMKQRTGTSMVEQLLGLGEYEQQASELAEDYEQADEQERANLEELKERRLQEEELETPNPTEQTDSVRASGTLQLILKDPGALSSKKADLSAVPSKRTLLKGAGARGHEEPGLVNDAYFLAYLLEYFPHAVDYLAEGKESDEWLDYQLEYLIAGKDSDLANLEAVCTRLLLIREAVNFAYIQTDAGKVAECEAYAIAVLGVTVNPALIEALKQVLLLTWSFAESVLDLRILLNGNRVAFYKAMGTWRSSLATALALGGLSVYDGQSDEGGLCYQDYLAVLLTATGRKKKVMRSLDVMEGVVREAEGRWFYVDQCTDSFYLRAICENGREWTAERWFCYEW